MSQNLSIENNLCETHSNQETKKVWVLFEKMQNRVVIFEQIIYVKT